VLLVYSISQESSWCMVTAASILLHFVFPVAAGVLYQSVEVHFDYYLPLLHGFAGSHISPSQHQNIRNVACPTASNQGQMPTSGGQITERADATSGSRLNNFFLLELISPYRRADLEIICCRKTNFCSQCHTVVDQKVKSCPVHWVK
jgi:hypothetical protein